MESINVILVGPLSSTYLKSVDNKNTDNGILIDVENEITVLEVCRKLGIDKSKICFFCINDGKLQGSKDIENTNVTGGDKLRFVPFYIGG